MYTTLLPFDKMTNIAVTVPMAATDDEVCLGCGWACLCALRSGEIFFLKQFFIFLFLSSTRQGDLHDSRSCNAMWRMRRESW
jgi:hypothetical protein